MQHCHAYISSDFLADIRSDRRSNSYPNLALRLNVNELEGSKLISGAKESAERNMHIFFRTYFRIVLRTYVPIFLRTYVRTDNQILNLNMP